MTVASRVLQAITDWQTVRCPCGKAVLGEVRGGSGEFRRVCPKCRCWWIVGGDGSVRPDPSKPPIDGTRVHRAN